jgi:hypothetical protein
LLKKVFKDLKTLKKDWQNYSNFTEQQTEQLFILFHNFMIKFDKKTKKEFIDSLAG